MTNPTPTRTITRAEWSSWGAAVLALLLTFLNWTGVTVQDPATPSPTASASATTTAPIPPPPTSTPTGPAIPEPVSTMPSASNTGPNPAIVLKTIDATNGGIVEKRADGTIIRGSNGLPIYDYVMKTDGEKLAGVHVSGALYMGANNISVTDALIDGGVMLNEKGPGEYFTPAKSGQSLLRVETPQLNNNGLKNVTIKAAHFTGVPNSQTMQIAYWKCVKVNNTGPCTAASGLVNENNDGLTITDSLFDGAKSSTSDKHLEAAHFIGVSHLTLRNNVINFTPPDATTWSHTTAALTMEGGVPCTDVILDGNWFFGGGYYQAYIFGERVTVTNNKFNSSQVLGVPGTLAQYPPSAYARWFPLLGNTGNTLDGKPFVLVNPPAR